MKFDCGETWQEREARLAIWHKKFAWWPTRVGSHDCRWLEVIERRGHLYPSWDGDYWEWEYRPLEKET